MSPSSSFKKKTTTNVDIHLYFSLFLSIPHTMPQQMTEINLIKTEKTSLNLSKQSNITNCSATADCIYVDVHVAGIGKEKT